MKPYYYLNVHGFTSQTRGERARLMLDSLINPPSDVKVKICTEYLKMMALRHLEAVEKYQNELDRINKLQLMKKASVVLSRKTHPTDSNVIRVFLHQPRIMENDSRCIGVESINSIKDGISLNSTRPYGTQLIECLTDCHPLLPFPAYLDTISARGRWTSPLLCLSRPNKH